MPRRDLRLAAPGEKPTVVEEEEDEEEGPRVISGTELERFMLPRVTFLCVVIPSRRPRCGSRFSPAEKVAHVDSHILHSLLHLHTGTVNRSAVAEACRRQQ